MLDSTELSVVTSSSDHGSVSVVVLVEAVPAVSAVLLGGSDVEKSGGTRVDAVDSPEERVVRMLDVVLSCDVEEGMKKGEVSDSEIALDVDGIVAVLTVELLLLVGSNSADDCKIPVPGISSVSVIVVDIDWVSAVPLGLVTSAVDTELDNGC